MRAARGGLTRIAAIAAGVVALLLVGAALIPSLGDLNPFGSETEDRSPPVVLKSLEKLSEYRAASANLQVVVDVKRDVNLLPDFIAGSQTLLVANGSVDAGVDFRGLAGKDLEVSDDRKTVTITLPRAQLSEARLDLERTRVYDSDRGLVDRIGDVFGSDADEERKVLELAQRKLADAARADPSILRSAETNTKVMLEGLMRGLGFETVTVRFAVPPPT